MKEFRCTMPECYPVAPWSKDPDLRQGHFENAEDEEGAARIMFDRYPTLQAVDVQLSVGGKTWAAKRINRQQGESHG